MSSLSVEPEREPQEEPTESKRCQDDVEDSRTSANEEASSKPAATAAKNSEKDEKERASKKRKLPQDSDPAHSEVKIANTDTGQEGSVQNTSVPSDLSTGTSRNSGECTQTEKSLNNSALVADHYNAITDKGLSFRSQSRIVYMRNFNNWIKTMLINEYLNKIRQEKMLHGSPLKVLDMCCGKGGDLLKWHKANISHLICADIAEISVEQCQNRYNELVGRSSNDRGFAPVFTAEFITADCTKVRLREKYKDASTQLDLVSCQFAFHYSFESLPQAECMLHNASESLRPGGYFIGTLPDANDLVCRWRKTEGNKFGNDIYSVEFLDDNKEKPPLFGAKYNFHLEGVVDCPEFLVHLPTLRKLALKYGLELVMFERFEDFYERIKDEGRSLLGKMQALETYPPYHEAPLLGQIPNDYQHAVQYMQSSTGHRKIGTLSQSEWEATTLYAVFAFQKMKSTWNAEGKQEYVKL
ncbi:mRNA cap guanine-N7 methyltransferase isoform X2 [Orussus abietinus]|nr:mRNA cap guanine-N7 methyltransferase isoform X2 [Orussus abietinus]XP_012286818.1 mRNA cap guanine-N7 methyltransferase isoform X2 [Orussus abietinus]XP_012286819.1 mRNA cap guanine-N7 methyltransferase isoform X2 [Orussus abietinus]XP_012286820.1 mRNA cap guanine-N7 methyltransferase isoform X2 [Orussus abietinus]